MSDDDPVHELTIAWLRHAESDLHVATALLKAAENVAVGIAFHAQQAIEKSFIAILVADQIDHPRTHQLTILRNLIPDDWGLDVPVDQLPRISQFAAETRYPSDDWNQVKRVTADEARSTVASATSIHAQVSERLQARGIIKPE